MISEAGCTLTPVSEGCEKDATDAEMEGNAHDMSYESSLKDYSEPTHSEIKVNGDDMKPCRESANKAPISSATQTEKSRKHSFSGEKDQGCDNVEQKEEDNDDVALNMRDAFTLEIIDLPETETRETPLLMKPEEHGSNEEEKERDSAIKCELAEMEGNALDMSYESNLKDYSDPTHSEIKVNDDDMKPCRESANKAPISSATQTEKSRKHSFSGEKDQGCDNVEQKEEDNDDVALNMRDAFTLEIIDLPETETRETPLLMKPEEHGSNEEEKERDSAIKCELAEMEGNALDMSYESNLKDYSDPTHSEIKVNDDDMKPCRESANKAPISSATQTEKSRKHSFSGEKDQGCDNVEQKEEDNDDVALNMRDAFTLEIIDLPETETRETALLMTPEEHESNEECELAAVSVKTFKDWLVDPNLYKVSLPDIKGKVIPIEVKTHNCSQAAVDGEQIYHKKMRSHVPISLFYISYTQRG